MSVFLMKSYIILIYLVSLMLGVSAKNSFFLWAMMDINLLVFLFLVYFDEDLSKWHVLLKYFLIQAFSSSLFLFSSMASSVSLSLWIYTLLTFSVMIKLGAAPLHWWVVTVFNSISYLSIFVLAIPQKVLPLMFLSSFSLKSVLLVAVLVNLMFSLFLIWQSKIKLLLAYSSLFSLSWMMFMCKNINFLKSFIFYSGVLGSFLLCYDQSYLVSSHMSNISESSSVVAMVSVFNLAGLPPFPGFWLKLILVFAALHSFNLILASFFTLISSANLYGYMKIFLKKFANPSYFYSEVSPNPKNVFFLFLMNSFLILFLFV